ncbi:hypothetical protein F4805DRAFT_207714 [Annulohypoxylon moriforme]|nr:hypothetical protein F4805DRAFT_207714 [Annulohypoxylon moriforme]
MVFMVLVRQIRTCRCRVRSFAFLSSFCTPALSFAAFMFPRTSFICGPGLIHFYDTLWITEFGSSVFFFFSAEIVLPFAFTSSHCGWRSFVLTVPTCSRCNPLLRGFRASHALCIR